MSYFLAFHGGLEDRTKLVIYIYIYTNVAINNEAINVSNSQFSFTADASIMS